MRTSEEWDRWYAKADPWAYDESVENRVRTAILMSHLRHARFRNTLDIGCGEGLLTNALSRISESTLGIDISVKAVERARVRFPLVRFEQGDLLDVVERSDLQATPFDLIVAAEVLYYLQTDVEREAAVAGLARLGTPQCVYYFSVIVTGSAGQRRYFTHEEFLALISRHFNVIDAFPSVARRPRTLDMALGFIRSPHSRAALLEAYTLTRAPEKCQHASYLAVKKSAVESGVFSRTGTLQ